jgi:hypothetical protein
MGMIGRLSIFVALALLLTQNASAALCDGTKPFLIGSGLDNHGVYHVTWVYDGPSGCDDLYNVRWGIIGRGEDQHEVKQSGCSRNSRPERHCHDEFQINTTQPWKASVQACHTRTLQSSECSQWATITYLPYGPDTCASGFVWREVVPSDHVCVTPQTRDLVHADNGQAAARRTPGPFGPDTCRQGWVWREATGPADRVCVTPQERQQEKDNNAQAAQRRAH